MARIWVERDCGQSGPPTEYWHKLHKQSVDTVLSPRNVLLVNVASFTFRFFSVEQIRDCHAYYSQKIHLGSRVTIGGADHWEVQRWFERLPMYLLEDPKRLKVVKALERALKLVESKPLLDQ